MIIMSALSFAEALVRGDRQATAGRIIARARGVTSCWHTTWPQRQWHTLGPGFELDRDWPPLCCPCRDCEATRARGDVPEEREAAAIAYWWPWSEAWELAVSG